MITLDAICAGERVLEAQEERLKVHVKLLIAARPDKVKVERLELKVEIGRVVNAVKVDEFTGHGSTAGPAYRQIPVALLIPHQILEGPIPKAVALDVKVPLEVDAEGDELLGNHGEELEGILPAADVIVDALEERFPTDLKVLEVAAIIVAGAVPAVGCVIDGDLPRANGVIGSHRWLWLVMCWLWLRIRWLRLWLVKYGIFFSTVCQN